MLCVLLSINPFGKLLFSQLTNPSQKHKREIGKKLFPQDTGKMRDVFDEIDFIHHVFKCICFSHFSLLAQENSSGGDDGTAAALLFDGQTKTERENVLWFH